MSDFSVGQKVTIVYCHVREELTGQETTITALPSSDYQPTDFSDTYQLPGYRVAIDPDFRPIAAQLAAVVEAGS